MKKPKVSILVPIYNVETFLPECLDSLINQTLKEIEIICINDGSTDSSPKIIKDYQKKDDRIVMIDKKNSGYGDSMNKGLEKATGEFVGIVESDDWIDSGAFEKLYKLATKYNVEVVKANFYEYVTKKKKDINKSDMFLPGDTGIPFDPRNSRHIFYQQPSIWSAIYKNDLLKKNDIKFLPSPGASYQDAGFNFKVWATARNVLLISDAFLHYRQDNPNSSVKSAGKIFAVKDEYDEVERYLKAHDIYDEYAPTLVAMRFSAYIWNMKRLTNKAARQFSKTVKEDYARAKKEGLLTNGKLDDIGRYNSKNLAIKHPDLYLIVRPIHDFKDESRKKISKLFKKLSPSYKQRTHTMDLIKDLRETQAELENKIEELEKIIDKEEK